MVSQNVSSFNKLQKRVQQQAMKDLVECCRENEMFTVKVFASESEEELLDVIHDYYDFNEFGGLCSTEGDILEFMYPNIDERIQKMSDLQGVVLDTMFSMSRLPNGVSVISAMNLLKSVS